MHKASLVFLLCIGIAMSAGKLNVERYLTLANLGGDYNLTEEEGRIQVWTRGFELLLDNPLTGVGVGGFGEAIGRLRGEGNLLPTWQAAHNSYLQALTETGVIGGTAFLLLILTCLWSFNRLRRSGRRADGDQDLGSLSGLLMIGFMAELVVAFFLSQAYSMAFTLFFAASASLRRIASSTGRVEVSSGSHV